ncbi:MAG: hypothetical protein KAI24_16260 [Planctomycetes bacterium]|nr:hypothetical protein [Planctomycetota bacterium]
MRTFARHLTSVLLALWLPLCVAAQGQRQDPAIDPTTAAALHSLAEDLTERRQQLAAATASGDATLVAELTLEIRKLRWEFAELASHLDVEQFEEPKVSSIQLEQEVIELIRPVLQTIKDVTAEPREYSALKEQRDQIRQRREVALRARQRVEQTRDALPEGSIERAEAEREIRERWAPLLDELGRELLVLEANLRRREENQKPMYTRIGESLQSFLQNSGLNVVLCVVTFLVTFFGLRWLSDRVVRRKRARGFSARLAEVLLRIMTMVVAIASTLLVLYARNDWLLLPVGIIFLIGAGWVVIKTAPMFFEQIRMILNVGPVREGERLIVAGLPYRVESLQFYSKLVNPELSGGLLRVPVKDLVGMRSRPLGHDEPWFPCKEGDVVALSDGVVGQVKLQTPEVVIVAERRDAPRSYPTVAFLGMNPRNLSHGFEVVVTFRVGYAHQQDAVTKVPQALAAAIRTGLADDPDAEQLRSVRVELARAGDSALDYSVLVEFGGDAARRYHDLDRKVNTLLVAACTEHAFTIPLPQLHLHGLPEK